MSDNLNEALADAEATEDISEGSTILDLNLEDATPPEYLDDASEVELTCTRAEIGKSRNSGNNYLRVDCEVVGQSRAPVVSVFASLPHGGMTAKQKEDARWRIREIHEAFGADYSGRIDVTNLVGLTAWAILGYREDDEYGPQNYVKAWTHGA